MIQIRINNEFLDIDPATAVTFKKAQELNGVQNQSSYSNNFNVENTSKNRRLLGINYLPGSKAKSMTVGYYCDVIFNGCIFLKKQRLKVQKETPGGVAVYLIFTEALFITRAREVMLNQLELPLSYTRNIDNFLEFNTDDPDRGFRTAATSAQDKSGLLVLEEMPPLIKIRDIIAKILDKLAYAGFGDILEDSNFSEYYVSPNVGAYGVEAVPSFDKNLSCYDFLLRVLKTFNGYIDASDSDRSVGFYLWKNINEMKANFVDYSDKFVSFQEYSFESKLAKKNSLEYNQSPAFYNSFFTNVNSITDTAQYLKSDFGAGEMRLFSDQKPLDDGTIEIRTTDLISEPKTINLYRFNSEPTELKVYEGGVGEYHIIYEAVSPNMLEIFERFHKACTDNITLPTSGVFTFRYDAIFLAALRMQRVFFTKQLSSYWLPLDLSFSNSKDKITLKALMIEAAAPVKGPIVFDATVNIDHFSTALLVDLFALYSAANESPAAVMRVTALDDEANAVTINGEAVGAVPFNADVSEEFNVSIENLDTVLQANSSVLLFRFEAADGGLSREARLTIVHTGRALYVSEFKTPEGEEKIFTRSDDDGALDYWNPASTNFTPINIPTTQNVLAGFTVSKPTALANFKVLDIVTDDAATYYLKVKLSIGRAYFQLDTFNTPPAIPYQKVYFQVYKNGVAALPALYAHTLNGVPGNNSNDYTFNDTVLDIVREANVIVAHGDDIAVMVFSDTKNPGALGTINSFIKLTDLVWRFELDYSL